MHDAGRRAFQVIADRVGEFRRVRVEFAHVGNELPRDWVGGIACFDQSAIAGVTAIA